MFVPVPEVPRLAPVPTTMAAVVFVPLVMFANDGPAEVVRHVGQLIAGVVPPLETIGEVPVTPVTPPPPPPDPGSTFKAVELLSQIKAVPVAVGPQT